MSDFKFEFDIDWHAEELAKGTWLSDVGHSRRMFDQEPIDGVMRHPGPFIRFNRQDGELVREYSRLPVTAKFRCQNPRQLECLKYTLDLIGIKPPEGDSMRFSLRGPARQFVPLLCYLWKTEMNNGKNRTPQKVHEFTCGLFLEAPRIGRNERQEHGQVSVVPETWERRIPTLNQIRWSEKDVPWREMEQWKNLSPMHSMAFSPPEGFIAVKACCRNFFMSHRARRYQIIGQGPDMKIYNAPSECDLEIAREELRAKRRRKREQAKTQKQWVEYIRGMSERQFDEYCEFVRGIRELPMGGEPIPMEAEAQETIKIMRAIRNGINVKLAMKSRRFRIA